MDGYQVRTTESSELRAKLDHPVIDGDAHIIECPFVLPDFLKQVGGADLVKRFEKSIKEVRPGEPKSNFWPAHTGKYTIDRLTTMLAPLYQQRIDEAGVDFCTLYPTYGFRLQVLPDDEVRAAACRALNMMNAELFSDVAYRMRPAATIPMHTPDEAIGELEFAVKELGMKAAMTCNEVLRPHPEVMKNAPELADYALHWTPLALDSPYDYDPYWAKCVELGVAPAGHSINYGGTHASTTNYVYNRLGLFATGGNAACRAMFMGGVTRRFPGLNVGFLEGGVWWAAALYNDLFEFWEKRNRDQLLRLHDPANWDVEMSREMFDLYGKKPYQTGERFVENAAMFMKDGRIEPGVTPEFVDDWKHLDIEKKEDIRDLFVNNFYFGCEADDALNYTAFNTKANKFGVRLKAMFSSDIGHWDVVDYGDILSETYEAVEDGLMTEEDFRDFVFTNPATFATRMNPDYFKGTSVEGAVDRLLSS
jgi:predicted TIM-barrel fold metal-dependent hydrolase